MGQIKIKDKWDQLTKDAVQASNEGISYGKLIARRYEEQQGLEMRLQEQRLQEIERRRQQPGNCPWCGGLIVNRGAHRKFCSAGCRVAWEENEERKAWEADAENRGVWKPQKREKKPKEPGFCHVCGAKLTGSRTMYCSDECYKEGCKLRAQENRKDKVQLGHPCEICGRVMPGRRWARFCSGECRRKAMQLRREKTKKEKRK